MRLRGLSEEIEEVRTEYGSVYSVNGKTTFARQTGKSIRLIRPSR